MAEKTAPKHAMQRDSSALMNTTDHPANSNGRDDADRLAGTDRPVDVLVVGPRLGAQLTEHGPPFDELEVRRKVDEIDALRSAPEESGEEVALHVDVVAVELGELGGDPEGQIGELLATTGAELVVVFFDFANRTKLSSIADARTRLARMPVTFEEFHETLLDAYHARVGRRRSFDGAPPTLPPSGALTPPRLFDDVELARLKEMTTTIECECPQHVAAIVAKLVAFERYSARCENETTADEELHRTLLRETSQARSVMEAALIRVLRHDGIQM